ncbi:hypothetical protein ACVNS2_23495 [Paenibacillus caseinilyticus]|uniref:Uncharacterized protein n=1 Tax=Paenibacillus mucilaginosus K02 TaxID=997761 RepID=I0BMN3_9BACL|nr:hypothetical protein [Paenibacillus mucilaginosus]AFH63630.1 hypothetical protein B2K_23565 [Paenibacillus mucilaginosus K02]
MFRLPLLFMMTGMASFILFHLLSLFSVGEWAVGSPRSPDGWFRLHLLVLDWATMIAMGAVYQLVDVVLQRRIHSERLGYLHYGCLTAGSAVLLAGFLRMDTLWIAAGASGALAGILLFAWNVGRTLLAARQWNPVTVSTACAVGYLALTGVLGMMMGLNFAWNWWGAVHERLLHAHIWLGITGWFGLLITGFSYKMLPMFYLSHGFSEKTPRRVMRLWNAGVLYGAILFLLGVKPVYSIPAVLLLLAALILYSRHMSDIRGHKHKKGPGQGIQWTVLVTRALILYLIALLCVWVFFPDEAWSLTVTLLSGWMVLWGWVAMTILGYLSKIIPFLWWTHKYGPHAGRPNVPLMSDLISERHVGWGLGGIAAGLLVTMTGTGLQEGLVTAAGVSLLSLCSLGYMGLIVRVFAK